MESGGLLQAGKNPIRAGRAVLKYFVHAYAFNLTFLALLLPMAGLLVLLVALGSWIGLLIGVLLLLMLMGAINSFFTRILWFEVRGGWRVYLVHGLILGLVILPAAFLLSTLIGALFPSLGSVSMGELPGIGLALPSFWIGLIAGLASAPFLGFLMVRIASVWKVEVVPIRASAERTDANNVQVDVPTGSTRCVVCGAVVPKSKLYCPSCGTMVT